MAKQYMTFMVVNFTVEKYGHRTASSASFYTTITPSETNTVVELYQASLGVVQSGLEKHLASDSSLAGSTVVGLNVTEFNFWPNKLP